MCKGVLEYVQIWHYLKNVLEYVRTYCTVVLEDQLWYVPWYVHVYKYTMVITLSQKQLETVLEYVLQYSSMAIHVPMVLPWYSSSMAILAS